MKTAPPTNLRQLAEQRLRTWQKNRTAAAHSAMFHLERNEFDMALDKCRDAVAYSNKTDELEELLLAQFEEGPSQSGELGPGSNANAQPPSRSVVRRQAIQKGEPPKIFYDPLPEDD